MVPALYCYEWMVTLEQEVKYIWAQRWTLSTWIFAVNRYATLLFAVVSVIPPTAPTYACVIALSTVESVFSALRVFALSGRKIWLFLVVFSLNLVPVATNTVSFLTIMDTVEFAGTLDCDALLNSSEKVWSGYLAATVSISTRGCVILADVIVLVVTWMKANGTVREALRFRIEVPLSKILIRDGKSLSCAHDTDEPWTDVNHRHAIFHVCAMTERSVGLHSLDVLYHRTRVLLGVNTLVLLINNLVRR
ncbi:hypothetical protein BC835DRAFT_1261773 [Cytidiella melzeri]|nr:hypothetical protein BC835DRAFT_1261773 [Cytidiella melzeri]